VFPLAEFLGERMARVRDPFGHLWILRQSVERLSLDEITRRRNELFEQFSRALGNDVSSAMTHAAVAKDMNTLSDAGVPAQAQSAAPARVHLVVGPVGAGKSTFARRLAREERAVRLALDEWMAELFAPDRPETGRREWYVERRNRCQTQMWAAARAVAGAHTDVVLELGLLRRDERQRFYRLIDDAGLRLVVHVLDAPRDVRRERVMQRNLTQGETFSMLVPLEFFELASDLWQPLEPAECEGRDVRLLFTHG
jgi:predicted kinase